MSKVIREVFRFSIIESGFRRIKIHWNDEYIAVEDTRFRYDMPERNISR